MFATLHHLNSGHLCARRRWLYNTFHTFSPLHFDQEQLGTSDRRDLPDKTSNQAPSSSQKGIERQITGPSIVENSKIRQHLDHIESTKHNLSLEDVERYKPNRTPDSRQPTYDTKYREIQNALTQSFTKPQLRRFLTLYRLSSPPSSSGKNIFVEILMKQWGMEPLAKVQEARADWKENSERLYPMSPAYAFLFMGKDGADLLNLTKRYNVQLSFISDPLSLKIQGLKGAVKQLDGYVKNFEEDITSETARIPHGLTISSQVTQSISRLSGAYVEASDDGKLFITYRKSNPASASWVKRLAIQAASKQLDGIKSTVHVLGESPSVVTKPIGEIESFHSFYPFFSPQISSSQSHSRSAFRLRRVGQWLRAGARYNIDGEDVNDVALSKESVLDIKARLLDELSTHQLPNSNLVVTATPGHALFLAPEGQTTFNPPIHGNVQQDAALKWAKENPSQVFFNPSVPKNLMTSWPHMESHFQRIVYKSLPIKSKTSPGNSLRKFFVLEIPRPIPDDSDSKASDASKPAQIIRCERKIETHADILLPSRAMDIRISLSRVQTITSSNIPKELQSFMKQPDLLTESVDPPLTVTLDGVPYVLSSTSQISQDHRDSSKSPKEVRHDFIIETTVDPEDGQELMVCQVRCTNPSSHWDEFITHCNYLAMAESKPSEHPLMMLDPWFQDLDLNANEGTQAETQNERSTDHSTKQDSSSD